MRSDSPPLPPTTPADLPLVQAMHYIQWLLPAASMLPIRSLTTLLPKDNTLILKSGS